MDKRLIEEWLAQAGGHAAIAGFQMESLDVDNVDVANALANIAIAKALIGIGYALTEIAVRFDKLPGEAQSSMYRREVKGSKRTE